MWSPLLGKFHNACLTFKILNGLAPLTFATLIFLKTVDQPIQNKTEQWSQGGKHISVRASQFSNILPSKT